ncbi:MAG: 2-isopropylmalate synthase, partial [bacterium]
KRPVDVGITDKSGAAGIAYWIDSRLGLEGARKIGKGDPAIARIREWVDRQYAAGRSHGISEEEMWEQVRRELPDLIARREAPTPPTV